MGAKLSEAELVELKEGLRRCSSATLDAAIRFREGSDLQAIPVIVYGILERYQPATAPVKLAAANDSARLIEDLGLDSLTLLEIVLAIEEALKIHIENEELREIRTVGQINQFLQAKTTGVQAAPVAKHYPREHVALVLPQQPPFLFLDDADLTGETVKASYTIKGSEFFLEGHFKDEPIFPASIVFEAMGQAACLWLLEKAPAQLGKEIKSNHVYFASLDGAQLSPDLVTNPRTGIMCASGGSMWLAYENLHTMLTRGVAKCQPMGIVNSIPGSLYINLVALFKIQGASLGCSSACSSSAHSLGLACDLIRLGRQDTVFVVGAEDCNKFNILPFAGVRALSMQTNPGKSPCAFDRKRDGFVGTGGSVVLVLEDLDHARQRGAPICAEILGWGQASDGYNVLAPDPTGAGLARAMTETLRDAQLTTDQVDYINAHGTATPPGDVSECRAVRTVFANGRMPRVSSTKSLTGHGLSLAGAMEAAFCVLALQEQFMPVSAHITQLDPECAIVPIITSPIPDVPRIILNNSSGFGGTNVSVALRRWDDAG